MQKNDKNAVAMGRKSLVPTRRTSQPWSKSQSPRVPDRYTAVQIADGPFWETSRPNFQFIEALYWVNTRDRPEVKHDSRAP